MTQPGHRTPLAKCLASDDLRPVRPASPLPGGCAAECAGKSARSWQSEGAPMYRILCVLMTTTGYGTAAAHCQAPQAGTTAITFQSSTYSDFRQLLTREAPTGTVTVRASPDVRQMSAHGAISDVPRSSPQHVPGQPKRYLRNVGDEHQHHEHHRVERPDFPHHLLDGDLADRTSDKKNRSDRRVA
jgi:hypothetical protein